MARTSKKIRYSAKKKIREGKFLELTKEEREWLLTHSKYKDVINKLQKNHGSFPGV